MVALYNVALAGPVFCVTVDDECCNGNYSSGTHNFGTTLTVEHWWVFYDSGDEDNNQVTIACYGNNSTTPAWSITVCGCGHTEVPTDVPNINSF